MKHAWLSAAWAAALISTPLACLAADAPAITLTIKDHRFVPATVTVPAGVRFQVEVSNLDATTEEFESESLHAEKVVVAGGHSLVKLGPLKPGHYPFAGEYHPEAQGELVAVAGAVPE